MPAEETLTYALVGNQNCGKTTLFNQLTGSNQHVGNFQGLRWTGKMVRSRDMLIPKLRISGIYSMSPYSSEEIVSRNFVLENRPKAVINIVDATNIERNMYLTMQLLEMDIPMVIALNMMDEVNANGGSIDINKMEEKIEYRLCRFQQPRTREWRNWYDTPSILHDTRKSREDRIL